MDTKSGKMRQVTENDKLNEHEVLCPRSRKAQSVMTGWGNVKRQRYAELVSKDKIPENEAFYYVEYQEGKICI